jgi:hypothetical protein
MAMSKLPMILNSECRDTVDDRFTVSERHASCDDDQQQQYNEHNNKYPNTPITSRRYGISTHSSLLGKITHFHSSV